MQGFAVQLNCACDPPQVPRCSCSHPLHTLPNPRKRCTDSCLSSCQEKCEADIYLRKHCPKVCTLSCSEACGTVADDFSLNNLSSSTYNSPSVRIAKAQDINFIPVVNESAGITTDTVLLTTSSTPVIQNFVEHVEKKNELKVGQMKTQKAADEDSAVQQLISIAPQIGKALLLTAEEQLERIMSRAFGKWNESKLTLTPQQRRDAEKVFKAIDSVGELRSLILDPHTASNQRSNHSLNTVATTTTESMPETQPPPLTLPTGGSVIRQSYSSYGRYAKHPDAVDSSKNSISRAEKTLPHVLPTYSLPTSSTVNKTLEKSTEEEASKCRAPCESSCRPQCVTQGIPLTRCILYCATACMETCRIKGFH
ncbi:unnamed protein product [Enterobius vermicularis]|uniref:ShKT domain-containing protein n=1 Tax=Enterobius vermicularis TaxID=51028 RepID=A0A0N4V7R6_ENTVE|nr:unnamed protein product [Enterobius vermicularis]